MSNTTTRILVGLVGIPAVIFIILQGGWLFFLFVQLIAVLALKELYDLAERKSSHPIRALGFAWCLLLGAYIFCENAFAPATSGFVLNALLTLFVLTVLSVELWRNKPSPLLNSAATVFGVFYIALFMESLLELRLLFTQPSVVAAMSSASSGAENHADSWGATLVMCLFAGIWICDSAAFFAGKAFGKHKLFPRVSPNKSWEGAVVGFLMSGVGFAALAHYFLPFLPIVHAVILGGLIGIVGQIGDLVESLLKRDAGVKDSSHIIPGHGGVFDRFDSVLFVAPVVYIYIKAFLLSSQLFIQH